jgi:hypothetical protein
LAQDDARGTDRDLRWCGCGSGDDGRAQGAAPGQEAVRVAAARARPFKNCHRVLRLKRRRHLRLQRAPPGNAPGEDDVPPAWRQCFGLLHLDGPFGQPTRHR